MSATNWITLVVAVSGFLMSLWQWIAVARRRRPQLRVHAGPQFDRVIHQRDHGQLFLLGDCSWIVSNNSELPNAVIDLEVELHAPGSPTRKGRIHGERVYEKMITVSELQQPTSHGGSVSRAYDNRIQKVVEEGSPWPLMLSSMTSSRVSAEHRYVIVFDEVESLPAGASVHFVLRDQRLIAHRAKIPLEATEVKPYPEEREHPELLRCWFRSSEDGGRRLLLLEDHGERGPCLLTSRRDGEGTFFKYHVWNRQGVKMPYFHLEASAVADLLRRGGSITLLSADATEEQGDPLGLRSYCGGAEIRVEAIAGRPPRIILRGLDEPEGVLLPRAFVEEMNEALGESRFHLPPQARSSPDGERATVTE